MSGGVLQATFSSQAWPDMKGENLKIASKEGNLVFYKSLVEPLVKWTRSVHPLLIAAAESLTVRESVGIGAKEWVWFETLQA